VRNIASEKFKRIVVDGGTMRFFSAYAAASCASRASEGQLVMVAHTPAGFGKRPQNLSLSSRERSPDTASL
jgi:hypothetical protein